jgi:hypothetical protein
MKVLLFIIFCFCGLKSFSQTNDVAMEEKSSGWLKITSVVTQTKSATIVKKKSNTTRPVTPKKNTQDEFEKTNSQVNRFKKVKKG